MKLWGWWVGVGQWWFVLLGLGWVGRGSSVEVCVGGFGVGGLRWSVVGWAFRCGVGGLGLVGRGLCFGGGRLGLVYGPLCLSIWRWWVGVGRS